MVARMPRDIQEALDRLEPRLRDAFLAAIQSMRDAAVLGQIEARLLLNDIEGAIEALRIDPQWFGPLHEAYRAAYIEGGETLLSGMKVKNPYDGSSFVMGFDGRHVRAERWVREQSSELITGIVDSQRVAARAVLEKGLEVGRHPRSLALDLVGRVNRVTGHRVGGFIGLTGPQTQWAEAAEAQLRGLDAGYFQRKLRDKRYDSVVARAIREGKPLAEADLKQITTRYRDRLLKARADSIARTESLNALRAGRHEGFEQLIDSGKVRADQVRIRWQATLDARVRDTHRALHDEKIHWGQTFTSPSGAVLAYPGDVTHGAPASEIVQCRCIAIYRIQSDLMRED